MITVAIVESTVTEPNPNGDSHIAWKLLKEKYNADTGTMFSRLKKMLMKSKMEQDQKLDDWIRELERVQTKPKAHQITFNDNDFMTHIIYHLTPEYDSTVEALEEIYDEGKLTMKKLKMKLHSKYKQLE